MGVIVDTNVFIRAEKQGVHIDVVAALDPTQKVYISAITASELLMGVHRADTAERLQRRTAFVEAIIAGVGMLDFDLPTARVHALIHAELSRAGQMIGAHDLIIAATARHHNLTLLTGNQQEFSRVNGLNVLPLIR